MYSREQYYHKCYTENKELVDRVDKPEEYRVKGHYQNKVVYIDTYSKLMYNSSGQAVMKFRH